MTLESTKIISFLLAHLTALEERLDKYFPDKDSHKYDWINYQIDRNISLPEISFEEELDEIRNK